MNDSYFQKVSNMGFICLAGTIFLLLNLKALQHKRLSSLSVLWRQSCTKHVKTIILFICRAFFTARESVVVPLQQKKRGEVVYWNMLLIHQLLWCRKKTSSHKSKRLKKEKRGEKKGSWSSGPGILAWNNILQISYRENYRRARSVQGKGARPDRDEDPHGQKETHTLPDFFTGGRRRKKWRKEQRRGKSLPGTESLKFSHSKAKKKEKICTLTENLQTQDLRKEVRAARCSSSLALLYFVVFFFSSFIPSFFTPAAAHWLICCLVSWALLLSSGVLYSLGRD